MTLKCNLSVEEAQSFVLSKGIRKIKEWYAYCDAGNDMGGLPRHFVRWFSDRGMWPGSYCFFGTKPSGGKKKKFRPFIEAREFARSLGLVRKNQWTVWHNSGEKPADIPCKPDVAYASEFVGWADWLGKIVPKHLSFEQASEVVRGLGIKTHKEYRRWFAMGNVPDGMPFAPQEFYGKTGNWKGWGVFLDSNEVQSKCRNPVCPRKARRVAKRMKVRTMEEYRKKHREWSRKGKLSPSIPVNIQRPEYRYFFKGIDNWFGTETLPYDVAKKAVAGLGVRSWRHWRSLYDSGKVDRRIQKNVKRVYEQKRTWISNKDFFGEQFGMIEKKLVVPKKERPVFLPFEQAREIARGLKIKTSSQWFELPKESIPQGVSRCPHRDYRDSGWNGWADWLRAPVSSENIESILASSSEFSSVKVYANEMDEVPPELKKEKWRDMGEIRKYQFMRGIFVSTHGRIYNSEKGALLSSHEIGSNHKCKHLAVSVGRWKMSLSKNIMVHRLVAMTFIPNPDNKPIVNHIDGNPQNNCVWNLEWVTQRENNYHAILTGSKKIHSLSQQQAYAVKKLLAVGGMSIREIANKMGVNRIVVGAINDGRTYKYVGMGEFTYPIMALRQIKTRRIPDEKKTREVKRLLSTGVSSNSVGRSLGLSRAAVSRIRDGYVPRPLPKYALKYAREFVPAPIDVVTGT